MCENYPKNITHAQNLQLSLLIQFFKCPWFGFIHHPCAFLKFWKLLQHSSHYSTARKCVEEFLLRKIKRLIWTQDKSLEYTFKWTSQTIEATDSIRLAPNISLTSWCSEICRRATKRRHEVYFYCIAHTEKDASFCWSLYIKVTFSQENP